MQKLLSLSDVCLQVICLKGFLRGLRENKNDGEEIQNYFIYQKLDILQRSFIVYMRKDSPTLFQGFFSIFNFLLRVTWLDTDGFHILSPCGFNPARKERMPIDDHRWPGAMGAKARPVQ